MSARLVRVCLDAERLESLLEALDEEDLFLRYLGSKDTGFCVEALVPPEKVDRVLYKIRHLALAGIRPTIENKNITFEYFETELSLWGDRDKVIQVLTNTISNAVKFTPEGGKITVDISLQPGQGKVSIRDTGKGIKKEDIPKVFDRFKQLENIDHHSTGTGLGMTISKSIIERLGGKIWIESEFGKGTTVNFTLPLAERMAENQSQLREKNVEPTQ